MIINNKIAKFFKTYISADSSPQKLARSVCVANFIAFSPFLGLHTVMVFLLGWVFALNIPLMLAVSHTVNNPWSAIPIYTVDYIFGSWLLSNWTAVDLAWCTPAWILSIEKTCAHYIGMNHFSFWAFFIGGNVLGIVISLLLYPALLRLFEKLRSYERQVSPI